MNEISKAMSNEHLVYLTSILSSQCISNVPSTILIGKFTNYAEALFLGSNIGGFGTLVGSMANMLVFKSFFRAWYNLTQKILLYVQFIAIYRFDCINDLRLASFIFCNLKGENFYDFSNRYYFNYISSSIHCNL